MATDYANGYASIVKYDKNDDGTLMVYGNATDDTLDLDSQICDPTWLDAAMPAWFKSGGNVREMHGPSAAGVAKEYEVKAGQHWIGVHVVDPIAVKKVENRVYQGFSIGIKSPRVVRDAKAANGRIIDGQIIEVSLVDRPANPSAKLILAKAVDGEPTLIQVEEAHEYNAPLPSEIFKHGDHDQSDHNPHGGGGSSSSGGSDKPSSDEAGRAPAISAEDVADYASSANAMGGDMQDLLAEMENSEFDEDQIQAGENAMNAIGNAQESFQAANNTDDEDERYDHLTDAYDSLNDAIGELSDIEHGDAENIADGLSELMSDLDEALGAMNPDHEVYGRSATTKTQKGSRMKKIERIARLAKSLTPDAAKFDQALFDNARKALAELIALEAAEMGEGHDERGSLGALVGAVHALMAWYEGEEAEGEVPMEHEASETIELAAAGDAEREEATGEKMCDKCNKAVEDCTCEDKEADADEADAEKTTEADAPAEEKVSEEVTSDDESIEALVEKAVKSAMEMVKAEIDTLRAEKESAVEKSVKLETELTTALSKTVAGGPKRTAIEQGAVSNEYLAKGLAYKAKADATTDPVLMKGYREIANELLAKANPKVSN